MKISVNLFYQVKIVTKGRQKPSSLCSLDNLKVLHTFGESCLKHKLGIFFKRNKILACVLFDKKKKMSKVFWKLRINKKKKKKSSDHATKYDKLLSWKWFSNGIYSP